MAINASKLGFGRREQEALKEQIDEGMNFDLWHFWTNMLFNDDDEECEEDDGWMGFEHLGYCDPDEPRAYREDWEYDFPDEDWECDFPDEELDFRGEQHQRYGMYPEWSEEECDFA